MPSTATYSPTGDPYINGVLSGIKWGVNTLTFSFPASASYYGSSYGSGEQLKNFEAFTSLQQNAVRDVVKMYSAVAKVTFAEVKETASVHGDLRYAESDAPSTAWAYYPSTNVAGGDAWFNNSKNWYDNPAKGTYSWLTMIHETGHAMGLKHPHEARGSFGAMPVDKDSLEYTVMSYRSYVGASTTSGYTNGSTSYPQTLMMYDIAGLQKMHGANYNTNAGDTVYSWSVSTGEMLINGIGKGAPAGNKIFMTIWDGGGVDTYNFANYTTGLKVDLNPGAWTTASSTQLASLSSGKVAAGNIANALLYNNSSASLIEKVVGGSGKDTILGNAAANVLTGGRGNDILDGRGGSDTAAFSGSKANYSWWANSDASWTIVDRRTGSPDGTDTLKNIEYLRFSDVVAALGGQPSTSQQSNITPVAANDTYSAVKNTKLTIGSSGGVLANDSDSDSDPLSTILVSGSNKGKVTLAADGSFVFTPNKNFIGTTSFKYKVGDDEAQSNTATVTLKVAAPSKAAKKKGAGVEHVDHEHMDEDQIPAPVITGQSKSDGWDARIDLIERVSKTVPVKTGDVTSSHLLATIFALGASSDMGHKPSFAFDPVEETGLPDLFKIYSSDFVLF